MSTRRIWTRTGLVAVTIGLVAATLAVSDLGRAPSIEAQAPTAPAAKRVAVSEREAVAAARTSGKQVEIAAERREKTTTYANPDGTLTREHHMEPVRTLRNGAWVPVDATMVRFANGAVGPKASTTTMWFSGGGDGPLATVHRMGRQFSMSWPGPLPTPVLKGRSATYPEVLPDVDLVINADVTGFSHVLAVKTPAAARHPMLATIAFRLTTERMRLQVKDGGLIASDAGSGGLMFQAPAPVMWDSGTGAAPGEDLEPARFAPETAKVAPLGVRLRGDQLLLTPNAKLLGDPALRFPIYIDPAWGPNKDNSAWTMIDSGYPGNTYWMWQGAGNTEHQRVGLCPSDVNGGNNCNSSQKKRIFFQIPTSEYASPAIKVLSSNFFITIKHVENTSNTYGTQLWRTGAVGSGTTWNNQPGGDAWSGGTYLSTTTALGTRDCADGNRNLAMDATAALQEAATNSWTVTTFGLKSDNEGWKRNNRRFCHNAYVSVNFNREPLTPTNLSSQDGGPCVTGAARPYVPAPPKLSASLSDPDQGDAEPMSAEFQVTWTPTGGTLQTKTWETPVKAPYGTTYEYPLNSAAGVPDLPQNIVVTWKVRASDGVTGTDGDRFGPWSAPCEFIVDNSEPAGPDIDSVEYLPTEETTDTTSECKGVVVPRDGVGSYGTFTFDSASPDVASYKYQFTGASGTGTETTLTPGTPGGPVSVNFLPTRTGTHTITVKSVDAAANQSTPASCDFHVTAGRAPIAEWKLDDPATATGAVNSADAGNPAAAGTGVTFGADGPDGIVGAGVQLDGTADAHLSTAVLDFLDTSKPFTVSAYVKLTDDQKHQTVVSQDGTGESGFNLGFESGSKKWVFWMPKTDGAGFNTGIWQVVSDSLAVKNKWTHLVASYDPTADKITLQIDGGTPKTAVHRSIWASHGTFQLGRRTAMIGYVHNLTGLLSSVRVFNRIADANDAGYVRVITRTGYWPLDEITAGKTKGYAANGLDVVDRRALGVFGDTTLRVPPETCTDSPECGEVDPTAPTELMGGRNPYFDFDGAGDYLGSTEHLVGLKGSFTLAARVRLAAACVQDQVVFSQPGNNRSRFQVRCRNNRWELAMTNTDTAGSLETVVWAEEGMAAPDTSVGTHLAVTYNYDNGEVILYVNGEIMGNIVGGNFVLTGKGTYGTPWNGTVDGGFQVGQAKLTATTYGSSFSGDMDEIRVYYGVLNKTQIQQIANTTVVIDK